MFLCSWSVGIEDLRECRPILILPIVDGAGGGVVRAGEELAASLEVAADYPGVSS